MAINKASRDHCLWACCCCHSSTIAISTRYHCIQPSFCCHISVGIIAIVQLAMDSCTSLLLWTDTRHIAGHTGSRILPAWIVGLVHHHPYLMPGLVLLPCVLQHSLSLKQSLLCWMNALCFDSYL